MPVPDACSETCRNYQWCPNYSSPLLPSENGMQVLELASNWTGSACTSSYAWAPWLSAVQGSANQPRRSATPPTWLDNDFQCGAELPYRLVLNVGL